MLNQGEEGDVPLAFVPQKVSLTSESEALGGNHRYIGDSEEDSNPVKDN